MGQRLLHLDFTIDPKIIGGEGFIIGGRVYTYFGVFPAFLRLPLALTGNWSLPVSRISCLLALAAFVWSNLSIARVVSNVASSVNQVRRFVAVWVVMLLLSGPRDLPACIGRGLCRADILGRRAICGIQLPCYRKLHSRPVAGKKPPGRACRGCGVRVISSRH